MRGWREEEQKRASVFLKLICDRNLEPPFSELKCLFFSGWPEK